MKLKEQEIKMKMRLHKIRLEELEKELKELNEKVVIMKGEVIEKAELDVIYQSEETNFENGRTRETNFSVEIIREGLKVICILRDTYDSSLKGVGVSRCCEDDEFDLRKGIFLAETRAKQNFYKCIEDKLMELL